MWLSEKTALGARETPAPADVGVVTAGGACPSVLLGGEKRKLDVAAPGGVFWAPVHGEQVVVSRCGDELFVTGALADPPDLKPGELCLKCGQASVRLSPNGSVELSGTVNVTGTLLLNGVDIRTLISGF